MDDFVEDQDTQDLISQLRQIPEMQEQPRQETRRAATNDVEVPQTPEQLEQYVIQQASRIVSDSLEAVENVKDLAYHVPNAENVASLSEVIKASTHALEVLNKLVNQNKKAETTIKVKEMDIQAKGALQHQEHVHQHKLSREEVLKQLVDGKDVIEVDTDTSTLSSAN